MADRIRTDLDLKINWYEESKNMNFSLFHKVTYIWLGENDLYNDRRNTQKVKSLETLCNKAASELLISYQNFIYEWENYSITDLYERKSVIEKFFRCSRSVLSRKAYNLKLISFDMYSSIVEESMATYKESKEPGSGNYYNTMVSRIDGCFMRTLCESIHIGRTTYTETFQIY